MNSFFLTKNLFSLTPEIDLFLFHSPYSGLLISLSCGSGRYQYGLPSGLSKNTFASGLIRVAVLHAPVEDLSLTTTKLLEAENLIFSEVLLKLYQG